MKQALSGKGNGGRGAHSGIIPEAVASCGLPLNLSTIAGIVYKDEDGDGLYGACLDVPMRDALVSAWYEKQLVDACRADQEGRYSLHVPAGRDHTLRAWLPPPDECYDPRLRLWGFFSTVEAVPAKFRCAAGSLDLPVRYRMLNYGPRDFTWELWHRGPVFDRENVVLVHGFRFPVASRRGRCDKQFGRLDDLLQTGDDQYNVWQFEYADRVRGTPDTVATYSARLHEAMSLVGRLTGRPRCSIIAYSLGGIIARKC
ncbi:MAG: hypothetical protein IBX68_09055, partial [Dehalococcoidia bacterium]|nr:hypothetical protein [Dehalococcoidia bacterium]